MTKQEIKEWAADTVNKIFHGHTTTEGGKNKKLRLLVTGKCPNKCPMCCNNRFDLEKIPVVDRFDYDEIMITGGEPLLFPERTLLIMKIFRMVAANVIGRKQPQIYIYTANFDIRSFSNVYSLADGFVFTPHSKKDVDAFLALNAFILSKPDVFQHLSLRLNIFPEEERYLPADTDLSLWKVKRLQWVKDCPVPAGEDFRRIAELW